MLATATIASHLHWCPRCETTWDCTDRFSSCAHGGSVVVRDHCAKSPSEDDFDELLDAAG